uniref:T9SS type A sorting domain-containing protein n=1 Tax=Gelidibacter sp. TaxID=2018083 RepID=UPI00404B205E
MKKITFLIILLLTITNWTYSQCTTFSGGNYGNLTMANDGTAELIATDNWPNAEFSIIEGLIPGNTYTVNATNTSSIYITVTETPPPPSIAIGTVITHGASSVSFTATTPDILIFWHLNAACATQASGNTLTTIQCTSASCACTATTAAGAPTGPTPANMATNVPIDTSGAPTLTITPFSWIEDTVNDPATNFVLSLGTDPAATNVGSINSATSGNGINYTWAYNTTYYWKVEAINCFGSTTSAVWSFTTEADPNLSVDEVENKSFKHFYNKDSDVLTMTSSSLAFEAIEIYNLLGQQVVNKNLSQTIETINMSSLEDGVYLAKVTIEGRIQTVKILKN